MFFNLCDKPGTKGNLQNLFSIIGWSVFKVVGLLLKCLFNSYHANLTFTIEIESEGKLPFLDTLVYREEDGSLKTNWYRKPTSSGRLLNYLSANPIQHKINTIQNLCHRTTQLSHESFHKENLNISLLRQNNYPS